MKKTNQMRINAKELCALCKLLERKTESFIDHYRDDGAPVYVYSEENEFYMNLYYKFKREYLKRKYEV